MTEVKKSYNIQPQTNAPVTNGFARNSLTGMEEPVSKGLKAAQVHGQVMQDDTVIRKPMRLEALNPIGKKDKKKKKNYDGYWWMFSLGYEGEYWLFYFNVRRHKNQLIE